MEVGCAARVLRHSSDTPAQDVARSCRSTVGPQSESINNSKSRKDKGCKQSWACTYSWVCCREYGLGKDDEAVAWSLPLAKMSSSTREAELKCLIAFLRFHHALAISGHRIAI